MNTRIFSNRKFSGLTMTQTLKVVELAMVDARTNGRQNLQQGYINSLFIVYTYDFSFLTNKLQLTHFISKILAKATKVFNGIQLKYQTTT